MSQQLQIAGECPSRCPPALVHFGGYQAFLDAWLFASRPEAKGVVDTFLAVRNMIMLQHPETNPRLKDPDDDDYDLEAVELYPDYSQMSNEELDRDGEKLAIQFMRNDPTFAVQALRDMGWVVSPPAADSRLRSKL